MDAKGKRGLRPALPVDPASEPTVVPVEAVAVEAVAVEAVAVEAVAVEAVAVKGAPPAAEIPPRVEPARLPPPEEPPPAAGDAWTAWLESQSAVARGFEAFSTEMAELARSGMDAAAATATRMLSVKTLSDAIDVNLGLARSSFDNLVGGAARLSEIGLKTAGDVSRPILDQIGKEWSKATGGR